MAALMNRPIKFSDHDMRNQEDVGCMQRSPGRSVTTSNIVSGPTRQEAPRRQHHDRPKDRKLFAES